MLWVSAATELTRAKVLSVSSWWKCPPVGCRRIHLRWLRCLWRRRGQAGLVTATRPHWCGGRRADWWAWLRCPWAVAGPGRGIELTRRSVTRHHWCGGRCADWWAWLRCRWVAAGPGRASRSTTPSAARVWRSRGRAAAHRHTQRPGPTKQPGPAGVTNQNLRNWEASRSTARSAGNAIL